MHAGEDRLAGRDLETACQAEFARAREVDRRGAAAIAGKTGLRVAEPVAVQTEDAFRHDVAAAAEAGVGVVLVGAGADGHAHAVVVADLPVGEGGQCVALIEGGGVVAVARVLVETDPAAAYAEVQV